MKALRIIKRKHIVSLRSAKRQLSAGLERFQDCMNNTMRLFTAL